MRIEPVHYWCAGVEIRPNLCTEVGDEIARHVHDHPHMTMATKGRWLMTRDDRVQELASASLSGGHVNEWAEIGSGIWHSFRVLELEGGVAALMCLWPGGVR